MADEIEVTVKTTEPTTVAFLTCKGPYTQMGEVVPKIFGWMQQKGLEPVGPLTGVYFNSPLDVSEEELSWEVRIPVARTTPPQETDAMGVGVKQIGPQEIAVAMHKGPYQEVGPTHGAIAAWAAGNHYEIAGPPEELYLNDPSTVPPEELLTQVRYPIKKK